MRLVLVLSMLLWSSAGHAADRVALVIGIANYSSIPALKNTVNDAVTISTTLEGVGFEVTRLIDATGAQIRTALDKFSFDAETADLALIYFAGHGVEVQGENYLIPANANVASNADVQKQSVSLKDFLTAVDSARKMRIVILDSCRDNPFGDVIDVSKPIATADASGPATRGGGGLAPPTPDRGTLVAFAARDGNVALDGAGDNSPFASALVSRLAVPDLEISLMFRQVRDQVLASTGNQQEPFTYGSLSGIPFYLAGDGAGTGNSTDDLRKQWSEMRPDEEAQFLALAEEGDTRSLLGLAYRRLNPLDPDFDLTRAAELLQKAATAGSAEAQYELASQYEAGKGVPQDLARALALYQQSAEQDYPDALNDMGFFYYQGLLGLPNDPKTALVYFERAADQRHPQAMYNFAALIDDGLVPGKGPRDAADYLYLALRSGSSDVLKVLEDNPKMLVAETRQALQRKLREFQFYDGTIDGDFGPGTQRGLRRAYGLTE